MASRESQEPSECRVSVQLVYHGVQPSTVRAVAGSAAHNGQAHIAVRIGRLLFYITDRSSYASWQSVWQRVEDVAERVLPEERDAFWEAQQADHRYFEATGEIETKADRLHTAVARSAAPAKGRH